MNETRSKQVSRRPIWLYASGIAYVAFLALVVYVTHLPVDDDSPLAHANEALLILFCGGGICSGLAIESIRRREPYRVIAVGWAILCFVAAIAAPITFHYLMLAYHWFF
jgi:hypothetical protein